MEAGVFRAMAQVAGIGGLGLGVFFLLFRDVIRKNIFPKFKNEKLAFRLLRLVVVLVWSIAIAGIAAWGWTISRNGASSGTIAITHNEFSGNMQFAGVQLILNQYQRAQGKDLENPELVKALERAANLARAGLFESALPLLEQAAEKLQLPAIYNNLGVLYAVTQRPEDARSAYTKALSESPGDDSLRLNFGLLEEKEGRLQEALMHYGRATGLDEAKDRVRILQEEQERGTLESEPNGDFFKASRVPLAQWIRASVDSVTDTDYFKFTAPENYRDFIKVEIANTSMTLRPHLAAHGPMKRKLWNRDPYYITPGQDLEQRFTVQPDTAYYLVIKGGYETTGGYRLRISPTRAYDSHEMNDRIQNARSIPLGSTIEANIMDPADADFFRFESGSSQKFTVRLLNLGKLRPYMKLFDGSKKMIWKNDPYYITAGQDLEQSFDISPHSVYYVEVGGGHDTYGDYRLATAAQ